MYIFIDTCNCNRLCKIWPIEYIPENVEITITIMVNYTVGPVKVSSYSLCIINLVWSTTDHLGTTWNPWDKSIRRCHLLPILILLHTNNSQFITVHTLLLLSIQEHPQYFIESYLPANIHKTAKGGRPSLIMPLPESGHYCCHSWQHFRSERCHGNIKYE